MIMSIGSFLRRIVVSYGADNLLTYLKGHIRADFLKKIKLKDMLNKNAHIGMAVIKRPIAVDDVVEDLVDMVIDDNIGPKVTGLLVGHARERGLSPEDSRALVHGGSLSPELVRRLEGWQDEFGKILYDYLNGVLKIRALKWGAKKKSEESEDILVPSDKEKETEEGETEGEPENVGMVDEGDIEKELEQENAWQKGLIEDIEGMLDREIGEDRKRTIYKALLKDRILGGQNLSSMVKEFGVAIGTLHNYEKDLVKRLEVLLKGKGLGPKFDLSEKEVVVPDYRVLLRDNKELQVDLKGWLKSDMKDGGGGKSDFTMRVLDLYAEGKTPVEVTEILNGNKKVIENTKSRYFNKDYAEWYRDHVEGVRKAGMIQAVVGCTLKFRSERA